MESQITDTTQSLREVESKLRHKPASTTVDTQIKLLHDYNEIRDLGQGLMGIVASNRGVRVKDVYEELGVNEKD